MVPVANFFSLSYVLRCPQPVFTDKEKSHAERQSAVAKAACEPPLSSTTSSSFVPYGSDGEVRTDPSDGRAYTRRQFIMQYGGTVEWDRAAMLHSTMLQPPQQPPRPPKPPMQQQQPPQPPPQPPQQLPRSESSPVVAVIAAPISFAPQPRPAQAATAKVAGTQSNETTKRTAAEPEEPEQHPEAQSINSYVHPSRMIKVVKVDSANFGHDTGDENGGAGISKKRKNSPVASGEAARKKNKKASKGKKVVRKMGGRMGNLVNKWKKVQDKHKKEMEPDDPSISWKLKKKKEAEEIEKWKRREVQSGYARDNYNFVPVDDELWKYKVKSASGPRQ